MRKAGFLVGLLAVAFFVGQAIAITVNPASNVTADSDNTAQTIVLRDNSGNFSAGTITASITGSITGGVSAVAASVAVSSSATSAYSIALDGAYTTAQIQAKTPAGAGRLVFNSTLSVLCISTGTTVQGYAKVSDAATCQ